MRKYKPDEEYLPYIELWAGKKTTREICDELDISIEKCRALARKLNRSLRVYGAKPCKPRDKEYFAVKPDPFKKAL